MGQSRRQSPAAKFSLGADDSLDRANDLSRLTDDRGGKIVVFGGGMSDDGLNGTRSPILTRLDNQPQRNDRSFMEFNPYNEENPKKDIFIFDDNYGHQIWKKEEYIGGMNQHLYSSGSSSDAVPKQKK